MLIDNAVFASLLSLPHSLQAMACMCGCCVGQCNVPQLHIPVQSLIAFSRGSHVKSRKNRYPLIDSKAVKILSSPEVLNQSLPSRNKGVEPSGGKFRLVASCTKMWNSCTTSKNRDYTMQMTCFFKNHEQITNSVHMHNLVSIAYHYLLW